MKRVVIESPYRPVFLNPGSEEYKIIIKINIEYAKKCLKDSLDRNESPYVSHLLLTQVLDDTKNNEREKGLFAAHQWLYVADLVAFYIDNGMSIGMIISKNICNINQIPYEMRKIKECI